MDDYRQTYSAMTDDQLLDLAQEIEALLPAARSALRLELANRNLRPADVVQYADELRSRQLAAAQHKPLAETFNGFGTKIYGKRMRAPDRSFLTTKWVVFFWIPLIPLKSLRVRYIGPGRTTILPGYSRRYMVLSESRPDVQQVANTYLFIVSFVIIGWALDRFHAGSAATWAFFAVWACAPWCLRIICRNRRLD